MGVCCGKSKKNKNHEIEHIGFPEIKVLDRVSKVLITLNPNEIQRTNFKDKAKIKQDSGIGLLLNSQIFLIGGTRKSGALTSKAFLLDPLFESIKVFPDVPVPVKKGTILEFENWLYYIGGVSRLKKSNNDFIECPAPLMRINGTLDAWEILDDKFSKEGLSIKNLLNPGSFVYNNKIYLIGGQIYESDKLRWNTSIYSIKQDGKIWKLIDEQYELPAGLEDTLCVVDGSNLEILSQRDIENKKFKFHFKIFLPSKQIEKLEEFPMYQEKLYPPIYIWNFAILVGNGEMAVKKKGENLWRVEKIINMNEEPKKSFASQIETQKENYQVEELDVESINSIREIAEAKIEEEQSQQSEFEENHEELHHPKKLKLENNIKVSQDEVEVEAVDISVENSEPNLISIDINDGPKEIEEVKQLTTPLPGLLETLTIEEREVFAKFKREFGSKYSDHTLGRFLRARKFNYEKSMLMFTNYLKWREENGVNEIASWEFDELPQVKEVYPHGFHKTDRHGRPIYIERIGMLQIKKLFEVTTEERMLKYYIREYEGTVNEKIPSCANLAGHTVEQTLTILDLGGASTKLMSKNVYKFIKLASSIAQDYYPEMLGKMFVVNTPGLFNLAWKVVRPWLDERTQSKISIEGKNFQNKLFELAPPENLPDFLGGTCNCPGGCINSSVGPWSNPKYLPKKNPNIIA